jgi:hypothetical protein
VAGSIGAGQLQIEAAAVEAALRRDAPPDEVSALLAPAAKTLEALLAALAAVVPPEAVAPATGPVDPEALRAVVERLERLLEQDDIGAVGALDAAAPLLAAAFGERAATLRKLVKGYRFEEAVATLREAAAGVRPEGPS